MPRKLKFSLLILISFLVYGCQFQEPLPEKAIIPSPVQETLQADKSHPTATATQLPTQAGSTPQSTAVSTNAPTPTNTSLTITPIFSQATLTHLPENQDLAENIDQILAQAGGRWHIVIKEINGPTFYTLEPGQRIHIASVVKVPLALLVFKTLEENGITEYQLEEYIHSRGTGGRTFEQLLRAMLIKSEEDATDILFEYIGENSNLPVRLREWQLQGFDLDARRATAEGVASLYERFYQGEFAAPTAQKLILTYLNEYTPNDEIRIGTLSGVLPENFRIYNKRGSLLNPYVVADTAIIENPDGSDYIMIIFAYNGEPETTYEVLDQAIGDVALAFWEYISNQGE